MLKVKRQTTMKLAYGPSHLARIVTPLLFGIFCSFFPLAARAAVIHVNTTDYGVVADGKCSLVEAILAANKNAAGNGCPAGDDSPTDTIVLASNATYHLTKSYDDYLGSTGLPSITSTVTISGNGAVIERQAAAQFRLLYVAPAGGDLTLLGVTLRNGFSNFSGGIDDPAGGGAIYNQGRLKVVDSKIVSNTTDWHGGGIMSNSEDTTTLIGLEFTDNEGAGGALYVYKSAVVISDTDFVANRGFSDGGAIFSDHGTITLTNSTLVANRAGDNVGGGIHNEGGVLSLIHTDIISNSAASGGGVYSSEGTVTLTNSQVLSNTGDLGGGIYFEGGRLSLTESRLAFNNGSRGGGIYSAIGNITVTRSMISANRATEDGGGLLSYASTLIITGSQILSNTTEGVGGGLGNYDKGTASITNSDVISNSARYGGGVEDEGATLTIHNSRFLYNRATESSGGAIWLRNSTGTIAHSCIVWNTSPAVEVYSIEDGSIDARGNWWGRADGPVGDEVISDHVDTNSYLTAPILDCPVIDELHVPLVATFPPAVDGSFAFGIEAAMESVVAPPVVSMTTDLGFVWLKQRIKWRTFEPDQGQINYNYMDTIVNPATAAHLNLLFTVDYAPDWAREVGFNSSVGGPPADPATYAAFVGAIAQRYCGTALTAIEVWDGENLQYAWGKKAPNPAEYMALLAPAYRAIKSACPLIYVISGAPTPAGDVAPEQIDDFTYLEQMFQGGLSDYSDGIGVHPGGYNVPPSATTETACVATHQFGDSFIGPCIAPHHSWSFRSTMEGYRNLADKYGAGKKLIWPTEFGWAAGGTTLLGYEYANDNSYDDQAAWEVDAFTMMRDWGWVGPAFLFNLNFRITNSSPGFMWGIVASDGTPLPAYNALKAMPK